MVNREVSKLIIIIFWAVLFALAYYILSKSLEKYSSKDKGLNKRLKKGKKMRQFIIKYPFIIFILILIVILLMFLLFFNN